MTEPKDDAELEHDVRELMMEVHQMRIDLELLRDSKQRAIPEEMRQVLQEIDAEFDPRISQAEEKLKKVENNLRELVVKLGRTVKGLRLQVVYFKPKITWNNERLEGYAASHPEVLSLRNVGEKGSAQIREVGKE